jgi:hypothetical protein
MMQERGKEVRVVYGQEVVGESGGYESDGVGDGDRVGRIENDGW